MKNIKDSDKETFYEILQLRQECSPKEIKSAFLAMSKSHHPDLFPNDPTKHNKFVRIMEAYTVLSKPHLRSSYDAYLHSPTTTVFKDHVVGPRWKDESIWEMRDKGDDKFHKDKPYYGIKGVKRIGNLWIAGGAITLMLVGSVFHFFALRTSSNLAQTQLNKLDSKLGAEWKKARDRAKDNGNNLQIELLEAKLSTGD